MSGPLYWCLLDEQPHYLIPHDALAPTRLDGLVVDPACRFSWNESPQDGAGGATRHMLDADAGFLPAACVAWVLDAASGVDWPYWIGFGLIDSMIALSRGAVRPEALDPTLRWVLAQAGILVRPQSLEAKHAQGRQRAQRARHQFKQGFAELAGLIPPFHQASMRRYYRQRVRAGTMALGDGQVDRRFVEHNEPVARFMQAQLTRVVSTLAGRLVKPSYAYVTAYQGGAQLDPHTDRPQCEYTLTVCLDFAPEVPGPCPWSINLDLGGETLRVCQRPGDGLLFRGRHISHHRDRLMDDGCVTNVLLHFVDGDFSGTLS